MTLEGRTGAVIGSGYMGGGIAQVLALAGAEVRIADVDADTTRANLDRLVAEARAFAARERSLQVKQAAAARQEREVQKQMRFVERFRSKARKASQVQSRLKQLEKVQLIQLPRATRRVHYSFPEPPRSGTEVIRLTNVSKFYADHAVVTRQSYFFLLNTCSAGTCAPVNGGNSENKFFTRGKISARQPGFHLAKG